LKYLNLKSRIKKNEGFSNTIYKDQLGHPTIGYGHLIKKNEKNLFKKKHKKNFFIKIFDDDFNKSKNDFYKQFKNLSLKTNEKELLIEMVFQIGIVGVTKFKKMLFYIRKKKKYLAALEMLDSLWYKQTPKRVENIIKHYLKQ
tara:strand:+ start:10284 stop:10712 length:429 start_codon:yes stop_codon:yes gene_type:complete